MGNYSENSPNQRAPEKLWVGAWKGNITWQLSIMLVGYEVWITDLWSIALSPCYKVPSFVFLFLFFPTSVEMLGQIITVSIYASIPCKCGPLFCSLDPSSAGQWGQNYQQNTQAIQSSFTLHMDHWCHLLSSWPFLHQFSNARIAATHLYWLQSAGQDENACTLVHFCIFPIYIINLVWFDHTRS